MDHDKRRHIIMNININHFPYISVAKTSDYFRSQNIFTPRRLSRLLNESNHCNISSSFSFWRRILFFFVERTHHDRVFLYLEYYYSTSRYAD